MAGGAGRGDRRPARSRREAEFRYPTRSLPEPASESPAG